MSLHLASYTFRQACHQLIPSLAKMISSIVMSQNYISYPWNRVMAITHTHILIRRFNSGCINRIEK